MVKMVKRELEWVRVFNLLFYARHCVDFVVAMNRHCGEQAYAVV